MTKEQMEAALEQAAQQHFCKLFAALVAQPNDDRAFDRFQDGVQLLLNTEAAVREFIAGELFV